MARPKKVRTDVLGESADMIEIKKEQDVINAVPTDEEVEITNSTPIEDKVTPLTAEVVKPTVTQNKESLPKPIYDIEELTDSDKQALIEKHIQEIIDQTQIPFIPALVRFREPGTTAVPPMFAVIEFDHRFVDEAWKYYQTNVREPYFKDYLDLLTKIYKKPSKIYTRLVFFDYE